MRPDELVTKSELRIIIREAIKEIKASISREAKVSPESPPKYYRNKDLKKNFGLSDNTIKKMRITGELPSTKLGSITLYPVKEINKILDRNLINRPVK